MNADDSNAEKLSHFDSGNEYLFSPKSIQNLTKNYEKIIVICSSLFFSPNGKKILFGMMKRDGFESDLIELHVYDFEPKTFKKLNATVKESVGSYVWSDDNETFYFSGNWHGHYQIYQISLKNFEAIELTTTEFDYDGPLQYVNSHLYKT